MQQVYNLPIGRPLTYGLPAHRAASCVRWQLMESQLSAVIPYLGMLPNNPYSGMLGRISS